MWSVHAGTKSCTWIGCMRQSLNISSKALPIKSWGFHVKEVWLLPHRCKIHYSYLLKIPQQTWQVLRTAQFYPELFLTHCSTMISSLSPFEENLWAAIIPSLHTSQDDQRGRADSSGREVSIATASCKMVAGIAGRITCLSLLSKKAGEDVEEGEQ